MERMIIVGSPRTNGRSASLAEQLFDACIDECPDDGVTIASVASLEIAPCVGCDACKPRPGAAAADEACRDADAKAGGGSCEPAHASAMPCAIDDDMKEIRESLDAADELIVVCPVYFSGAPAQMKALIDRLQPYYWTRGSQPAKRPLVLHVVGEGGDPHGFDPLVGTVRSAFACAGFELELVLDWVGKIDEDGVIVAEADEYEFEDDETAAYGQAAFEEEGACASDAAFAKADADISEDDDDDYGDVTWNR